MINISANGLVHALKVDKMIDQINSYIIKLYKTKRLYNFLFLLICFFILTAFMFWVFLPSGMFYVLDALGWFLVMFLIYGLGITYLKDRFFNYIVAFGVLNTFNNLLDETIYQNFKLTYAEILVSVIITITLTTLYVKRRNR